MVVVDPTAGGVGVPRTYTSYTPPTTPFLHRKLERKTGQRQLSIRLPAPTYPIPAPPPPAPIAASESSSNTAPTTLKPVYRKRMDANKPMPLLLSSFPTPPTHIPASPMTPPLLSLYTSPISPGVGSPYSPNYFNSRPPSPYMPRASSPAPSLSSHGHGSNSSHNPPPSRPPSVPLPPVPSTPSPIGPAEQLLLLAARRSPSSSRRASLASTTSTIGSNSLHSTQSQTSLATSFQAGSSSPRSKRLSGVSLRTNASSDSLRVPGSNVYGRVDGIPEEDSDHMIGSDDDEDAYDGLVSSIRESVQSNATNSTVTEHAMINAQLQRDMLSGPPSLRRIPGHSSLHRVSLDALLPPLDDDDNRANTSQNHAHVNHQGRSQSGHDEQQATAGLSRSAGLSPTTSSQTPARSGKPSSHSAQPHPPLTLSLSSSPSPSFASQVHSGPATPFYTPLSELPPSNTNSATASASSSVSTSPTTPNTPNTPNTPSDAHHALDVHLRFRAERSKSRSHRDLLRAAAMETSALHKGGPPSPLDGAHAHVHVRTDSGSNTAGSSTPETALFSPSEFPAVPTSTPSPASVSRTVSHARKESGESTNTFGRRPIYEDDEVSLAPSSSGSQQTRGRRPSDASYLTTSTSPGRSRAASNASSTNSLAFLGTDPVPSPSLSRSSSSLSSLSKKTASQRSGSPDLDVMLASTPRPRRTRSASRNRRSVGSSSGRNEKEMMRKSTGSAPVDEFGSLVGASLDGLDESDDGSGSDSSLDLHTPLPHLMFRDGLLSPRSKLFAAAQNGSPLFEDTAANRLSSASHASLSSLASSMSTSSNMTKSGLYRDERDTARRRVRHRDGRLLRGGIGLTTGLGWSDSEDEDAPSPLTRQLSSKKSDKEKERARANTMSIYSSSGSVVRPSPLRKSTSSAGSTVGDRMSIMSNTSVRSAPAGSSAARMKRVGSMRSLWSEEGIEEEEDVEGLPHSSSSAGLPTSSSMSSGLPRNRTVSSVGMTRSVSQPKLAPRKSEPVSSLPGLRRPSAGPSSSNTGGIPRKASAISLRQAYSAGTPSSSSVPSNATSSPLPPRSRTTAAPSNSLSNSTSTPRKAGEFYTRLPAAPRPLQLGNPSATPSITMQPSTPTAQSYAISPSGSTGAVGAYNRATHERQRAMAASMYGSTPASPGSPGVDGRPRPRTGTGMVYKRGSGGMPTGATAGVAV